MKSENLRSLTSTLLDYMVEYAVAGPPPPAFEFGDWRETGLVDYWVARSSLMELVGLEIFISRLILREFLEGFLLTRISIGGSRLVYYRYSWLGMTEDCF